MIDFASRFPLYSKQVKINSIESGIKSVKTMLIILCITILAYKMSGRDIQPLLDKIKNVDWQGKLSSLWGFIKKYSIKAGRGTCRIILQFYYVMKEGDTTTAEKAMIYAAIAYTVLPISILPRKVFGLLGVLDEGGAVLFVYNKIKDKITPTINRKVDETLDEWFGVEVEYL